VRDGVWSEGSRTIPEETAIAFVIDGSSEAVMMATPADLEDFACGFALCERLIETLADIRDCEFAETELGIEARLWLREGARSAYQTRRRRMAGPVGCGLCGVESLEAAMPKLAPVETDFAIPASELLAAMAKLPNSQPFNAATRAVHAAAFYRPGEGFVFVREDVGRHNALDKLIGALARAGQTGADGAILITSRVSIELIQKAAYIGAGVLAAISAPTALAVETADKAGISVCGIVRENGLEVFTRPDRIKRDAD
jgi:FdhD protein